MMDGRTQARPAQATAGAYNIRERKEKEHQRKYRSAQGILSMAYQLLLV
jgi:hypothetical protein